MTKFLYNRLLRPVLAVVMVVSLALGVASSAWPAARQAAQIQVLAEAGIGNLRTLSIAVTELGEDRLAALVKTPMQGNDFKKMSGLLTEVRDAAGYDRLWLVPPFVCLCVSGGTTAIVDVRSYTEMEVQIGRASCRERV